MTSAITLVFSAILTLFGLVLRAIGFVDHALGHAMDQAGIDPHRQMLVLTVLSVVLGILALRLLGGVFAALLVVLLLLLLVHHALPGMAYHATFSGHGLTI